VSDQLWTVRDVARYLGVPTATIYSWRSRGEGPPGFRVGKHLRFRPSEVEAWLEAHREDASGSCLVRVEDGKQARA
jgi:excisionase family DNA binding protein